MVMGCANFAKQRVKLLLESGDFDPLVFTNGVFGRAALESIHSLR